MSVQVSHEIPLSLIDEHQDFISDYMFVLLHKILEDEQYANTVLDFSDHGEIIYLDNSCFELGESLDNKLLYEWYQRIEPEYVVLPDVLGDYRRTLQRSIEFADNYPEAIPNGMPVIQGSTPDEMIDCYNEFINYSDKWGMRQSKILSFTCLVILATVLRLLRLPSLGFLFGFEAFFPLDTLHFRSYLGG